MKKFAGIVLVLILLLGMCSCSYGMMDPVIRSLPPYKGKVFYTSGGFQDFTDYAKYTYKTVSLEQLEKSAFFKKAAVEDIEEILLHIENFEGWVRAAGGELQENYDFDKSIISEGDYFYIDTKYGEPIGQSSTYGKFDSYNLYYFDVDAQVLYYFHNNI